MVNVLPSEELKDVWRFYRSRFVLTFSIIICIVAAVAFTALLPAYVSLWWGSKTTEQQLNTNFDPDADKIDITHSHDLLSQLTAVGLATSSPLDVIRKIIAERPKGITFTRLTYTSGKPSNLVITGISARRENINAFHDALMKDGSFATVNIPIGDLVGTNNSQFTVTLTGAF